MALGEIARERRKGPRRLQFRIHVEAVTEVAGDECPEKDNLQNGGGSRPYFDMLTKSAIQPGPVESAATNLHFHLWALVSSAAVDLVCFQRTLDVAFERKELKFFKQFLRHSSCE